MRIPQIAADIRFRLKLTARMYNDKFLVERIIKVSKPLPGFFY